MTETRQPERRRHILRHFLYLDADLLRDFLSEYEGGIYEEENAQHGTGRDRTLGANLGAGGAAISGKLGRSQTDEVQRTVRQTPASQFGRLHDYLESDGLIQMLPACDDDIWTQLEVQELVEVPAIVNLPGLTKLIELAAGFSEFLPMFGDLMAADAKGMQALQAFTKLHAQGQESAVGIIASIASSPRYRFVGQLDRRYLRVPTGALEGEATVLGKLQRKLNRGETISAVELFPGMNRLGRKQLREFERKVGKPQIPGMELGDTSVSYPGAVLTPIAIYR